MVWHAYPVKHVQEDYGSWVHGVDLSFVAFGFLNLPPFREVKSTLITHPPNGERGAYTWSMGGSGLAIVLQVDRTATNTVQGASSTSHLLGRSNRTTLPTPQGGGGGIHLEHGGRWNSYSPASGPDNH